MNKPSGLFANPDNRQLWEYFCQLSQIPRASRHEAAAIQWVAKQGKALGCQVSLDTAGNVLLRQAASPGRENHPTTCLQAHIDMVCEKNEGTVHDFSQDPLKLRLDGDWLRAEGTSLGADNGIGVCAALAVLADDHIQHGPLEVLITVDEEEGFSGVKGLQSGSLKARYLLNLDSEEEGTLTIGCAGDVCTIATRKLPQQPPAGDTKAHRLRVFGLKGGHSGMEIHLGRANAIRLLAQVLVALKAEFPFELAQIQGGNKRNAIPREAAATILLSPAKEEAFRQALARQETNWRAAYGAFDPDLQLSLEPGSASQVINPVVGDDLLRLLLILPHGIEAMSPDIPGLVQTSTNLGILTTQEGVAEISLLTRSAIDTSRTALTERIAATGHLAGFTVHHQDECPGWQPDPGASLVQLMQQASAKISAESLQIVAIHAGLECGIIGEKHPGLEMVSFGPDMKDVHTPDEQVSVSSVAHFWKLLVAALEII